MHSEKNKLGSDLGRIWKSPVFYGQKKPTEEFKLGSYMIRAFLQANMPVHSKELRGQDLHSMAEVPRHPPPHYSLLLPSLIASQTQLYVC